MNLVIGGFAQAKIEYVKSTLEIEPVIFDAVLPTVDEIRDSRGGQIIINHLNLWIKNGLCAGKNALELEREIINIAESCHDIIIVSDEVGSGVVPLDEFERNYRETTGRILTKLAKRAEGVTRVICGIGQKIK